MITAENQLRSGVENTSLKCCLFSKSELLVAVEASKVAEKNVLEEQRISVQDALQQKIAEHSALQQEHSLVSLFSCNEIVVYLVLLWSVCVCGGGGGGK